VAIEINIDEQGKNFIISDETKVIRNNRRSQSYFSEFLNASFDGVLIIIPIPENEDKDILLRKVQKALNKYQIEQV
jgi:hypothetical protein